MSVETSGRFVWRELITPALDASRTFYAGLFGWNAESMQMGPEMAYTLYKQGDTQVAGMMEPMMAGTPPFWLDYITVDDVDASREKVVALGGTALTDPMDIPGIGRFAVVQDPAGATFALFRSVTPGASGDDAPPAGTFCWSQLMSTNLDRAVPFYAAVFGWEPTQVGEMTVFNRNGRAVSSAMQAQMGMPSHWLAYVAVPDADAATAKAGELGAKVLLAPTTRPGRGRYSVFADPGGAVVAVWKDLGAMSS
jgi:uncharacterized protein